MEVIPPDTAAQAAQVFFGLNQPKIVEPLSESDRSSLEPPICEPVKIVSRDFSSMTVKLSRGCAIDASRFWEGLFGGQPFADQAEMERALKGLGAVNVNGVWLLGVNRSGEWVGKFAIPIHGAGNSTFEYSFGGKTFSADLGAVESMANSWQVDLANPGVVLVPPAAAPESLLPLETLAPVDNVPVTNVPTVSNQIIKQSEGQETAQKQSRLPWWFWGGVSFLTMAVGAVAIHLLSKVEDNTRVSRRKSAAKAAAVYQKESGSTPLVPAANSSLTLAKYVGGEPVPDDREYQGLIKGFSPAEAKKYFDNFYLNSGRFQLDPETKKLHLIPGSRSFHPLDPMAKYRQPATDELPDDSVAGYVKNIFHESTEEDTFQKMHKNSKYGLLYHPEEYFASLRNESDDKSKTQ